MVRDVVQPAHPQPPVFEVEASPDASPAQRHGHVAVQQRLAAKPVDAAQIGREEQRTLTQLQQRRQGRGGDGTQRFQAVADGEAGPERDGPDHAARPERRRVAARRARVGGARHDEVADLGDPGPVVHGYAELRLLPDGEPNIRMAPFQRKIIEPERRTRVRGGRHLLIERHGDALTVCQPLYTQYE